MSLQNSQRENVFTLNLKLMESTEGSKIFVRINKAFTLQLGTGYLNHFLCGWLSIRGSPSYSSPQPLQEKSLGPLSSEANLFSLLVTAFLSSSSVPPPPNPQILGPSVFQVNPDCYPAFPNGLTLIRPYVLILAQGGRRKKKKKSHLYMRSQKNRLLTFENTSIILCSPLVHS